MLNNYLHLELVSYIKKEDILGTPDNMVLISSRDQINQYDFQKSIIERIENSFYKNEFSILTTLAEKQNFIVITPNKEIEILRLAGASVYNAIQKMETKAIKLSALNFLSDPERYAFLEGMLLKSFHFDKYKNKKQQQSITIYIQERWFSIDKIAEITHIVQSVSLTKAMVNEPPNYMDALQFSKTAAQVGKEFGFKTEVLHKEAIVALKMGGLLSVNKGSAIPPTFNIFHYKPENAINENPLVLVGKGVMFDTGGYSLKISGSMTTMKSDMAGGAAVLGVISAIAANKLPYHVIGLVPATDNKISSGASVVDDIITMMDGTTVEIQNTDAEGRLVLADALTYAKRFQPELVIDIATLTGASAAITGSLGIAMAGTNQEQMHLLQTAGEGVYERLFQLPFWKEFADFLKSDIADLKNIGGPVGGATTAAKFLEHFTDYPWIHLDIAGASFMKDASGYRQNGATGVAVRLIYEFIKKKCESLKKI